MRIITALIFMVAFVPFYTASAREVPERYTNENILTSLHEAPLEFAVDEAGDAVGTTTSGRQFRQYAIGTPESIRLQRFQIDDAFWYVSDKGIIWADSDLSALSVYLSLA